MSHVHHAGQKANWSSFNTTKGVLVHTDLVDSIIIIPLPASLFPVPFPHPFSHSPLPTPHSPFPTSLFPQSPSHIPFPTVPFPHPFSHSPLPASLSLSFSQNATCIQLSTWSSTALCKWAVTPTLLCTDKIFQPLFLTITAMNQNNKRWQNQWTRKSGKLQKWVHNPSLKAGPQNVSWRPKKEENLRSLVHL